PGSGSRASPCRARRRSVPGCTPADTAQSPPRMPSRLLATGDEARSGPNHPSAASRRAGAKAGLIPAAKTGVEAVTQRLGVLALLVDRGEVAERITEGIGRGGRPRGLEVAAQRAGGLRRGTGGVQTALRGGDQVGAGLFILGTQRGASSHAASRRFEHALEVILAGLCAQVCLHAATDLSVAGHRKAHPAIVQRLLVVQLARVVTGRVAGQLVILAGTRGIVEDAVDLRRRFRDLALTRLFVRLRLFGCLVAATTHGWLSSAMRA